MKALRWCAAAMVASLFIATPARAQVLIGYLLGNVLSTKTFNIGFEIGANFSTLENLEGAERVNRTVFGLFYDWRFSEHFHLGGSMLPIAERGAQSLKPIPTGDPDIDAQTADGTLERTIRYLELPVLLKWAPDREKGIRIGVGPSLGLITGAIDRYTSTTALGNKYVLENDIEGQLPGLDLGLSADVEWRFAMLSIAARYTEGLTDLRQPGAAVAVHSRALTGTGRIYLGRKNTK